MLTCDCCGTHMTIDFLEFCEVNHMLVCLRTPNCSQSIQFEDLVNFWVFKNGATELEDGTTVGSGQPGQRMVRCPHALSRTPALVRTSIRF